MPKAKLAACLAAAILMSACAPAEPPRAAAPPVAGSTGVISGPAPVPSPGSMAGSAPDYVLVGQDPVLNMPDTGSLGSPDESPYGRW